ncbi:MAG TPA: serine hydrolase domain-containing protein [Candidatus Eremiobacteraceae bacterium]|nr:serine hydrolase domain-containing protein [Candidatus Eremiobacteraceae bacterium]
MPQTADPTRDQIQKLLQERILRKQTVGIIAGIIDQHGTRCISAGTSGNAARPFVDEQTLFEIGSITKLFTAAALADALARGIVALDDPLSKFLSVPPDGIGDRTLKELATHTSGLPRLPSGFTWWSNLLLHLKNPYANYSQRNLEAYLGTLKGKAFARGKFLYSNLGAGLLGNILATREHTDFATLISQRVTGPLGLTHTYFHVPPQEQSFVAQPHNRLLRPTPVWIMTALSGAGGLLSCMTDMLRFASCALAGTPPLFPSMLQPLADTNRAGRQVGLGWMLRTSDRYQMAWHNGGTGGSRSFLGVDLVRRRAIVVLSNSSLAVDQLAVDVLLG